MRITWHQPITMDDGIVLSADVYRPVADGRYPVILTVQHGLGDRAKTNPNTGESVAGAETLPDEDLAKNRTDPHLDLLAHPLCDDWHRERTADLAKVTVPFLSCANWGGQGIHPRGNFNGLVEAASTQKWLPANTLTRQRAGASVIA